MTVTQREAFLALPDTEEAVMRFHHLDAGDLAAIATARTPETRLGYALQLCCLRYPGRHLRRGETLPAVVLDHVADQIGVEADVIAGFARRNPTRYDQLATIKARFGFTDLSHPMRARLRPWLEHEAIGLTDGRVLLERFLDELRSRRIVIPGISVVERLAAEAMFAAERRIIGELNALGRVPSARPLPRPRTGEPANASRGPHPRHRRHYPVQLPLSRLRRRRVAKAKRPDRSHAHRATLAAGMGPYAPHRRLRLVRRHPAQHRRPHAARNKCLEQGQPGATVNPCPNNALRPECAWRVEGKLCGLGF